MKADWYPYKEEDGHVGTVEACVPKPSEVW